MDHRLKQRMVSIVAGLMMLLMAGGTVWMRHDGSSYTTAAEGLVVAKLFIWQKEEEHRLIEFNPPFPFAWEYIDDPEDYAPCPPADSTFGTLVGKKDPFGMYFQNGNEDKFCWTKAWQSITDNFA